MIATKRIFKPFGRIQEEIAKLTDGEKMQAAVRYATRIGGDDELRVFKSREFMARMIRKEEASAHSSKWRPAEPLGDSEGYKKTLRISQTTVDNCPNKCEGYGIQDTRNPNRRPDHEEAHQHHEDRRPPADRRPRPVPDLRLRRQSRSRQDAQECRPLRQR